MQSIKKLLVLAFIFGTALQAAAQIDTTKVLWKNLAEKYESFGVIKPIIVNVSDKPIYFNCLYPASDDQYQGLKLLRKVRANDWEWNVWRDGVVTKKSERDWAKSERKIAKLKQANKYTPKGCKLNPNEEFAFSFDKQTWDSIINGDTIMFKPYKDGKFRFELTFETIENAAISASPEFLVLPAQ